MSHVSPKKMEQKVYDRIFADMVRAVAETKNNTQSKTLIETLLTPTERTMLAKRYALMLMLKRGVRPTYIHRTLKVSFSTIATFSMRVEGTLPHRRTRSAEEKKREAELWDTIETLLRLGLPPRVGPGRWRGFYR